MSFAVIIGICFIILIVLLLLYVLPMFSMHPLESGKIEGTDIIAMKNRINNLFFIPVGNEPGDCLGDASHFQSSGDCRGDWIVIDAGSDAKSVKLEMEKMAIDGRKVKAVFLTHTDYDHVASITLFPNAVIYMSEQEKQMIDGSTNRQFIKKNSLPKLSGSNKIIYLPDNEMIDFYQHKIRIFQAPGHTKGSAMYVMDEKYLFTGDAFKIANGHITVHPYTMDRKAAQETIHGVKGELKKYEKVFTAHYGLVEMT